METFYTDKANKFECYIDVDGADINETKARLTLKFDDKKTNYLYEGNISSNGKFSVKIPQIKYAPVSIGKAVLEVIAESTYFEPWNENFVIKQSKNVSVKRISEETENDDDLIDENIKINVKGKESISETNTDIKSRKDEYIDKNQFMAYMNEVKDNESLLLQYVDFKPKSNTIQVAESLEVDTNDKNNKSILFFLEKKVL